MKRGGYLQRHTPMRRKARRPRKGDDRVYLEAVRGLPCKVAMEHLGGSPCEGRIHAHHAGRRPGVGLKASDDTAVPLCEKHHRAWHDGTGVFQFFDKWLRFGLAERWIAETRAKLSEGGAR